MAGCPSRVSETSAPEARAPFWTATMPLMLPTDRGSDWSTVPEAEELARVGVSLSRFETLEAWDCATAREDPRISMLTLSPIQVPVLRIVPRMLSRELTFSKFPPARRP